MKLPVLLSVSALIPFIFAAADGSRNKEPQITCVSEFDYDYKTLKKIVELDHAQVMLKNTIKARQQMLQDIIQKVASLEKNLNSVVAFTAIISSVGLTELDRGAVVIFDRIITNIGQAYNRGTGIFTAPAHGLYVFDMDIMDRKEEERYLELVRNGTHVIYFYGSARGAEHYVSSSRVVTLELELGDRVWIRTSEIHRFTGSVHGNGFSSFSGWLQKGL